MDSPNASLDNLSDIIIPDPVSFWPLGQGFYLLLLALVIAGILCCYISLQRYRINQYRRVGLGLLEHATTVHDVSVILKRVALAAFPREKVASLYGIEWVEFLRLTCPGCDLARLTQSPEDKPDRELVQTAAIWIRKHRVRVKE